MDTGRQPAAVWPVTGIPAQLARWILTSYSQPEQLVCDPMCGPGTVIVEAARLGRRSLGVERTPHWVRLASVHLARAAGDAQRRSATIRVGDPRHLPAVAGTLTGSVDVVVAVPPNWPDAADRPAATPATRLAAGTRTSRAELGRLDQQAYLTALGQVYAACYQTLRPGGLLVVVTQQVWQHDRLTDVAGRSVTLARQAGFVYLQHVIALRAAIHGDHLVTDRALPRPPSPPPPGGQRVLAHHDVLVFRRPPASHG